MQRSLQSFTFGRRAHKHRSSRSDSKPCLAVSSVSGMDLSYSHSATERPGIPAPDAGNGAQSVAIERLFELVVDCPKWAVRLGGTG